MPLTRIRQTAIGNDSITSAKLAHDLDLDGDFVRVPHGTTAQRPSSPVAGYMRFNTDQGTLEQWNTTTNSWQAIDSPPIITSLAYSGSLTAADPAGGETITLTGTNFKSGATVTIGGTSASSVSIVDSTTITFTTPVKTAGDYDVVVVNANGLQATLTNGISYNGVPAFTTAAGNVGSIVEDQAMSTITIVAAEPDGGTLAFSVTSGALPTGVSLGSANGQLTGTPNVNPTSDTTFNFTVTATDDENQTNSRAFNLIVLRPIYATPITQSLRLDRTESWLTQTPSTTGNVRTWTLSCWVKRSTMEQSNIISSYTSASDVTAIMYGYGTGETLQWYDYQNGYRVQLTATEVSRDTAAWYHLVFVLDTTQATSSDRAKIYINGRRVTDFVEEIYPSQNADLKLNRTIEHQIGNNPQNDREFDGYMADIHFIDGQALSPTDFAEEYYGVWTPKAYSGTYGTNGYRLEFDGDSRDSSGNSNHWIPNNIGGALVKYSGSNLDYPDNLYKVLDGDDSTAAGAQGPGLSTSASIVYTPPTPITVSSSLKFKYSTGQTDCKYRINGGSYVNLGSSGTVDFNTGFTGTLTSIEWYVANSNSLINVFDLRVDDVQVVNYDIGYDAVPDSPTTNFATFNYNNFPVMTFAEGALKITTTTNNTTVWGSQSIPDTGKWYFEMEATNYTAGGGVWTGLGYDTHLGDNEFDQGGIRLSTYYGGIYLNNTQQSGGYANQSTDYTADGDVYSFAIDMDNELFYIGRNGTWFNSADPSAGTGGLDISANITAKGTKPYVPVIARGGSYNETYTFNFGQDSTFVGNRTATSNADSNGVGEFAYTVPTNFLSLCAKNLSESTINTSLDDRPEDYFNTVLYTGDGTSSRGVTGVGFAPDWVWLKTRDTTGSNFVYDTIRGATNGLHTNLADAETTYNDGLLSFDSDGFTIGNRGNHNGNNELMVAWCWKAGGAPTATNSAGAGNVPTSGSVMIDGVASTSALAGTIPATKLTANTKTGFSIVSYTGTGSNATVAHGLSQTPEWVATKSRDSALSWYIYVPDHMTTDQVLAYNAGNAQFGSAGAFIEGDFNATTFGVGTETPTNKSGDDFIAYCFHSVEGYSKIGSYVGNGNANGSFIHTGFRSAWVMIKNITTGGTNWLIFDNKRSVYNVTNDALLASSSNAESVNNSSYAIDILSNGFKARSSYGDINQSGNTFIYLAYAEDPFKYAEAR